jgi:flagellar biosynthesis chaperone FliJ
MDGGAHTMIHLEEILRTLNEPLTLPRLEALRALLPQLEEQLDISQERLQLVSRTPEIRRKASRRPGHQESQREALQEIQSYLTTLELTITRVRNQINLGNKLQESRQFAEHIQFDDR